MRDVHERFWTKVNKSEGCWVWTGATSPNGYGNFWVGRKTFYVHRLSYEWANGPIPDGSLIDHRCHNRGCVRPDHLRIVTPKQNLENRRGSQGKSGVRGVSWDRTRQRWYVYVKHQGRTHYVGGYDTLPEAEAAAIAKRLELFTHNDVDRGLQIHGGMD